MLRLAGRVLQKPWQFNCVLEQQRAQSTKKENHVHMQIARHADIQDGRMAGRLVNKHTSKQVRDPLSGGSVESTRVTN